MKTPQPVCSFPPVIRRLQGVAIGLLATAMLFGTSPRASAGTVEVAAINARLAEQGVLISTASAQQLADAVVLVITGIGFQQNRVGIVIGEALKGAGNNAPDAGEVLANSVLPLIITNKEAVAALAVRTAGTGGNANVSQVGGFASVIATSTTEAINIAAQARQSRTGQGAFLGGFASTLPDDATRIAFTNSALANARISPAAREVGTFVGETADDPAIFAVGVGAANAKLSPRLIPGIVAAAPTDAGEIMNAVLQSAAIPQLKKQIAAVARNVGAVADIEEIQKVGNAIGLQIRAGTIKLGQAAGITRTLAQAIARKPETTGLLSDPNRRANKRDEIGELAAYVLGGIFGSTQVNARNAANAVVKVLRAAVDGSKAAGASLSLSEVAADVAGSVAFTVAQSTLPSDIKAAIQTRLLTQSTANQIAGKANGNLVFLVMQDAFNGINTGRFEDGNDAVLGAINDPETDIRNF
jgi:hypothetical protein